MSEHTVYVGNIDASITTENLFELFIQIGPIVNIKYPVNKVTNNPLGYAFIEFTNVEDVEFAINCMSNCVFLNNKLIKVKKSFKNNNNQKNSIDLSLLPIAKVFLKFQTNERSNNNGNNKSSIQGTIDSDSIEFIDKNKIKNVFKKFGELAIEPELVKNDTNDYIFLYFKRYEDADKAISTMNGRLLNNRKVNLSYSLKEGSKNEYYGTENDRLMNKEGLKNGIIK